MPEANNAPEGFNLPEAKKFPEGYINNPICSSVSIKKIESGFAIIDVYVDDINLIRTLEELKKAAEY